MEAGEEGEHRIVGVLAAMMVHGSSSILSLVGINRDPLQELMLLASQTIREPLLQ
jgi:hypothetical protein